LPFCHVTLRGQRPLPRGYPGTLGTLGDHLRRRRLDLGLLQREVAERLGVAPGTVTNWELNRTSPALSSLPGIICLLGYNPTPPAASLGERLKVVRRQAGLSQEQCARLLGVDPSTLSRWERNIRVPTGRYARLAEAFVERFARQ